MRNIKVRTLFEVSHRYKRKPHAKRHGVGWKRSEDTNDYFFPMVANTAFKYERSATLSVVSPSGMLLAPA